MQIALTAQHPSENVCVAGDAVEYAEETDIPLSLVSIGGRLLCNLLFPDDIDLLRDSLEELQRLIERLEKTVAGFGMEISSDGIKFSSKASRQDHLTTYGSLGERWKK